MYRLVAAVNAQQDSQGKCRLCRRNDQYEDYKKLSRTLIGIQAIEGNQIYIGGIEHQLNTHQYGHGVRSGQDDKYARSQKQNGD